jgi:single-strand DNA-binding protein
MNITVLHGTLSSEPRHRLLPSGDELISYEVSTELADGVASVPVVWLRPRRPPAVATGDAVVVIGHVRRRFFRAAGGAASRTEVVASTVLKPDSRRLAGLLTSSAETIQRGVVGAARIPPAA